MTPFLYRLGGFSARHPAPVLILWIIAVVAIGIGGTSAGLKTSNSPSLPDTGSQDATDLLEKRFPSEAQGSSPVVVRSVDQGDLTSPANRRAIDRSVEAARKSPFVLQVESPFEALAAETEGKQPKGGGGAISLDRKVAFYSVTLKEPVTNYTNQEMADLAGRINRPLTDAGLESAVGGNIGAVAERPATDTSEGIGVLVAIVILLIAFGSAVSMLLPIVTAILGLAVSTNLIMLLSHVISIPTVGPTLGVMIGLGVGIDYSLFILSRHREQADQGMDLKESIARSVATSGSAVTFAGGTVIIALLSLAVAQIPIITAMGYTAAIAVVCSILAATTLLPALLGLLGHRYDSLRIPFLRRKPSDSDPDHDQTGWARWARWVANRKWGAAIVSLGILLVLAFPTLSLEFGQADTSEGPKDAQATRAYDYLSSGFGPGSNGPILVAVRLDGKPDDGPALARLGKAIKEDGNVASVSPPQLSRGNTAATITVTPKSAPQVQATQDLVDRLRTETIPKSLKGTGLKAYVGGVTASFIDLGDEIADKLPLVIATVIALSFLLLLIAFRSIAIPAQAAVMNLLGVAASYGLLVAVFQWGWGTELIGLSGAVPIVSVVPLFMFAILFGLSMDYEVFLVSHIGEEKEAGASTTDAVVRGLSRSAKVITSAALIMVAVFGSFILTDDPTTKQFGLGLAFAIAIDATLIRCVLVPAVMVIFGKANWWLPGWLDRILPRIGIEGTEFLEKLDAEKATATPGASSP
ncbi:MAG: MMPL family transporter [Solirubrobacterales bacterium]